jgi:hypothetical protein
MQVKGAAVFLFSPPEEKDAGRPVLTGVETGIIFTLLVH